MVTKSRNQSAEASRKKNPTKTQTVPAAEPAGTNGAGPSAQDTLRRLYTSLLRCRLVQEHAQRGSSQNYELAIGHEAIAVAPTVELAAEDTIVAADTNLAALVARGLPLEALLAGTSDCTPVHSVTRSSVPNDPFNLATGLALAHRLAKQQHVVVAFCAQSRPALESWHEALKFAGVHKLPIVFVIKNGVADQRYPSEHAPHLEAFSFMARDYGYPGIIVDGQDVVAVWRAAHESIHRARTGSGPTLIDCRTDSGQDPIAYMEHYMRRRNLWDDAWKNATEAGIMGEIERAELLRRH